jgi:hypothetical protein
LQLSAPCDLAYEEAHEVGVVAPGAQDDLRHRPQLRRRRLSGLLHLANRCKQPPPRLAKNRLEHGVLRLEVVVHQPVGDACVLRDVTDAGLVIPAAREHPDRGVEDQPALLLGRGHNSS